MSDLPPDQKSIATLIRPSGSQQRPLGFVPRDLRCAQREGASPSWTGAVGKLRILCRMPMYRQTTEYLQWIPLDTRSPRTYLLSQIRANLSKDRDAKERVLVRPTTGGDIGVRDEEADPHKTAALPKMRRFGKCGFFIW